MSIKKRTVSTLVILLAWLVTAPANHANPDRLADALEEALGFSFAAGDGFLQFGAQADAKVYTFRNGGPTGYYFPKPGRRTDSSARGTLTLDAFWQDWFYGFVKFRWDDGIHPGSARTEGMGRMTANEMRWDELFVRIQGGQGRFNLQAGRFTPVFGVFLGRHDTWDNPFVNAPLTYENVSTVADFFVEPSPVEFAGRRDIPDNKDAWVSPVWAPLYVQGLSAFGTVAKLEYAVTFANRAPSSRPTVWDDNDWSNPSWYGHIAWRPDTPWRFGVRGSYGPYMLDTARPALPRGRSLSDYTQELAGVFGSYAYGRWQVWGDWTFTRYKVPNVGFAPMHSWYVETQYQFGPRLFAAVRLNQQLHHRINHGAERLRWAYDLYRIDLAVRFRPYRSMQLKGGYSFKHQDAGFQNGEHLWVAEATWRF